MSKKPKERIRMEEEINKLIEKLEHIDTELADLQQRRETIVLALAMLEELLFWFWQR